MTAGKTVAVEGRNRVLEHGPLPLDHMLDDDIDHRATGHHEQQGQQSVPGPSPDEIHPPRAPGRAEKGPGAKKGNRKHDLVSQWGRVRIENGGHPPIHQG